jgi:hypothetical protein
MSSELAKTTTSFDRPVRARSEVQAPATGAAPDSLGNQRVISFRGGDGRPRILAARSGWAQGKEYGEIAVYGLDLREEASASWEGTCWDAAVLPSSEGRPLFVAASLETTGRDRKTRRACLRLYELGENGLKLRRKITCGASRGRGIAVASLAAGDLGGGRAELVCLTLSEQKGKEPPRPELRIYDSRLRLKASRTWRAGAGEVDRFTVQVALAELKGRPQIITALNLRREGKLRPEVRAFDRRLRQQARSDRFLGEKLASVQVNRIGSARLGRASVILLVGEASAEDAPGSAWLGLYDGRLVEKKSVQWRAFRDSWAWDVCAADVDGDGRQEIVTFGGSSMRIWRGHVFSECRLWDRRLRPKGCWLWQTEPGKTTLGTRGCALDGGKGGIVAASSRWGRPPAGSAALLRLEPSPAAGRSRLLHHLAEAWERKEKKALERFLALPGHQWQALVMEALATRFGAESVPAIKGLLKSASVSVFRRAVQVLAEVGGDHGLDALRQAGFATTEDWVALGPFDNTDERSFGLALAPERAVDLGAAYAGQGRVARWGRMAREKAGVLADLFFAHWIPFERTGWELNWDHGSRPAFAYALTRIQSPSACQALLKLGTGGGVKVWLNDRLVWTGAPDRELQPDDDAVAVKLRKGGNRVLLKVGSRKGRPWGFSFRVTAPSGVPVRGFEFRRPEVERGQVDFLSRAELADLARRGEPGVRCLAAAELARCGERSGLEALAALAGRGRGRAAAEAALALVQLKDRRGVKPLLKLTRAQDPLFQLQAGYALRAIGERGGEAFAFGRVKDKEGKPAAEMQVEQGGQRLSIHPTLHGERIGDISVTFENRFHFGEDVSARCASIMGFGMFGPEYRAFGVGEEMIRQACKKMAQRGCSCATVATGTRLVAHRLYCRVGYVDRIFPWTYGKQLGPGEPPPLAPGFHVRRFEEGDRRSLKEIRRRCLLGEVGSVQGQEEPQLGSRIRVVARDGKLAGFAEAHMNPYDDGASVSAMFVAPGEGEQEAARALLFGIEREARARGLKSLSLHRAPQHFHSLLPLLGYEVEPSAKRYGWVGMFMVIDLPKLLREIAPLLERRLARPPQAGAGWQGKLALRGERLQATLSVEEGKISVARGAAANADVVLTTSDAHLTRLVCGSEDIWECYRNLELSTRPRFTERLRRLLEALFPLMPVRQRGWW